MALLRRMMHLNGAPSVTGGPSTGVIPVPPRGLPPIMPTLPETMIKDVVLRQDRAPQASRLSHVGFVHVSSLIGMCARQYALAHRFEVEVVESVTGGHRVMWAMGRAVEKHVRGQYLKGVERANIYGVWKCRCESINHLGLFPGHTCNSCKEQATRYFEPVLRDEVNKIVGSPDITMIAGRFFFLPVELKSMNKEQFDALEAPLPDHIAQNAMYRYLYQQAGFLVHDKIKFVYTTKDFKYGDPYKEYQIDCTQPAVVSTVEYMVATAAEVQRAKDTHTLPNRSICQSPRNGRAKSCPVAHLCFGMGETQ